MIKDMSKQPPYLDTLKSVIISSPAGSGKTEKLARRYISLLSEGAQTEKILCITFTEKAAAEMKQRILSILAREYPELLASIRERIPLMRISTIHAFCLKVLKRFSPELGLDPSLDIADEFTSDELWTEAFYECISSERGKGGQFFNELARKGLKGMGSLKRLLDDLQSKAPYPEIILGQGGESLRAMTPEAVTILSLYSACLKLYKAKKTERRLMDYSDLELLALDALSLGAQSHNILYSFDEHTDHILVDEFQDTNTLQWGIIDRLTEEWRSGRGAKREAGKSPSIFLVGDEKQSIYLFRNANVGIFRHARHKLDDWMGDEFSYIEVKENYRSLPAITSFTNSLFGALMRPDSPHDWMPRYAPFEPERKEAEGQVELLLFDGEGTIQPTRQKEAELLSRRILSLADTHDIYIDGTERKCRFEDMAILLRKRTHLGLLESALSAHRIPYVVVKGMGFFNEPEVAVLRELASFLVAPDDNHALFCVLRSPFFGDFGDGGLPYQSLRNYLSKERTLISSLRASGVEGHHKISGVLDSWRALMPSLPLSVIIETAMDESGAWGRFSDSQRTANIKKFISLVESYESEGYSQVEIREKLIRLRGDRDVSKANLNTEGMDAVKIMTIHAAKGLQFPIVFLPAMDDTISSRSGPIVIDDSAGQSVVVYEEEPEKRKKIEAFRIQRMKEEAESKRLFYVAVTRARDMLSMSGARPADTEKKGKDSRLGFLFDAFGSLEEPGSQVPFTILHPDDIPSMPEKSGAPRPHQHDSGRVFTHVEPIVYKPSIRWAAVTEDIEAIRNRHGAKWVTIGSVMHAVLEELSLGTLKPDEMAERAIEILKGHGIAGDTEVAGIITADISGLKTSGMLEDIILPSSHMAYTELPFTLDAGDVIYSGRMDRVIVRDGEAHVYDYKSFPVREAETAGLIAHYKPQMERYRAAAAEIFRMPARCFLVLTHERRVVES